MPLPGMPQELTTDGREMDEAANPRRPVPYLTSQLAERSIATMGKELSMMKAEDAKREIEKMYGNV